LHTDQVAGILLISGSTAFGIGAAIGVPNVFTERDPKARLRMLEDRRGIWRVAQPFYGLGPIIASVGAGYLAAAAPTGGWTRTVLAAASVTLVIGALTWAWSVYLRATRISEFAFGTLPGWPFTTYVVLTIGGLGLLSIGLLAGGFPVWLGLLTLGADILFLGIYVRFKDIPPFVFYLLLMLVGVVVLARATG
jgi:hypothetical protein